MTNGPKPITGISRESGRALIEDANRWERAYTKARNDLMAVLVQFYYADAAECARVCDEMLDTSGELLNHVRGEASASIVRVSSTGSDAPLGEQLREARQMADLTQVELAERFNVSPNTIHLWESGQTPRARHRRAIREFVRLVNDKARGGGH